MRCPSCGSDTNSALPRCTRCNAALGTAPAEDATTPDPHSGRPGEDATVQAPYGGGTAGSGAPGEPPPPPWTSPPQEPAGWGSPLDQPPPGPPPDHTTPMPPGGETYTQLSPEPWAEPAIWQPPAPPKKSRTPYFLGAAGAVLLFGLALGIVLWPSGSDAPAQPTGDVPSVQGASEAPPEGDDPSSGAGDAEAQAKAVDDLLEEMGGTRSELGGVVTSGCPTAGLRRVLDARRSQLETARSLDVSALENGPKMKEALVRALEASAESNQRYLDFAPGCPTESDVADVNQRASSAKSEFISYWSPIAEEAGLPTRTESDI